MRLATRTNATTSGSSCSSFYELTFDTSDAPSTRAAPPAPLITSNASSTTNASSTSNASDATVAFSVELLTPYACDAISPTATLPLFMTQWNHREWALRALSRGYASLIYPAADTRDAAPAFQRAYRQTASMALIPRR